MSIRSRRVNEPTKHLYATIPMPYKSRNLYCLWRPSTIPIDHIHCTAKIGKVRLTLGIGRYVGQLQNFTSRLAARIDQRCLSDNFLDPIRLDMFCRSLS